MKKNLIVMAVAGVLGSPTIILADDDNKIEWYGKVHLSVDAYSDARVDGDEDGDDSGIGVASNSSRLGFKGKHKMDNGMKFVWQYESQINIDDGNGSLANRNTYAGFSGNFGKIIAGNHDTPLKRVVTKWDPFNETVGEARSVLGQPGDEGNNSFNTRAKNMIMYTSPKMGGFKILAQYGTDSDASSNGDNNDRGLFSAGFEYKNDMVKLWGGYESQMSEDDAADDGTALRLSGIVKLSDLNLGLLYEAIEDSDSAVGKRDGYGAFVTYKIGKNKLKLAYYAVDEYDEIADSDAAVVSVGWDYKLASKTKMYLVYSALDQGNEADFRLGRRGHGDRYRGVADGDSPNALSLGVVHKF